MMRLFLRRFSPMYARALTRRFLDGVHVDGLERVRALLAKEPLILASNHVCWWDGQILQVVHRALGVHGKFIVQQESIDRLPYLEGVGGFGLARHSVSATLASLERAAAWLDGPQRSLWMFPQGRFRPHYVRPLELRRGVEVLAKLAQARVVPVALTYHPLEQHLPACVVSFGEPLEPGPELVTRLERAIVELLDAQTAWLDDPTRAPKSMLVPSGVVPFDQRLGSRIYMAFARLFGSVQNVISWMSTKQDTR